MLYLSTIGAMLLAACVCTFTFIVVDKRTKLSKELSPELKKAEDSEAIVSDSETNSESGASAQESLQKKASFKTILKQAFTASPVMRPVIFIISVLSVGVICFCAQILNWGGNGLDSIGFIKILITAEILMSAAVSDFFIKKIPNFLPLTFLASGVIILIFEYFFMRESFFLLLGSSLIGLVVGFIILLLMSIITKGGIGMGDVKLISTMGFLTGIAASFYTFVLASFLCLAVTIVLLITKVKKMKDELPFGPFIFIGYIFVVILGRF